MAGDVSETDRSSRPRSIRVGVVGTGIGARHVEALGQVPGTVVAAVCSARRARAEAVAARFDVPLATDDYRELLAADLDAVVIATPPPLHAPMALEAIAAGLHVFCEKPLAANLAEARLMRDAAHAAGIVHAVGHQARYLPSFARAKQMSAEGYLGRLAVADCQLFMNPSDYLRSPAGSTSKAAWYADAGNYGGILASAAGPHQIDFLRWFGGSIVAVAAEVAVSRPELELADGTLHSITAADTFLVLARFASGALATIRGLPIPYHALNLVLDLHGTLGSLQVDFRELRGATSEDRAPVTLTLPAGSGSERVAIVDHFVAAIRSSDAALAAALPTFDDGVAIQAVIDACFEAAGSGAWIAVDQT